MSRAASDEKRTYEREYYARNREKMLARVKLHRINNKEEINERQRKRWADNKEKIHAQTRERREKHKTENPEKLYLKERERRKKYKINNPEKVKTYAREWARKNIAEHPENREKLNERRRRYVENNKEKVHASSRARHAKNADYARKRRASDPEFRLRGILRTRVYGAIRLQLRRGAAGSRGGSAVRDLGCSILEFMAHIESLFESGMSWDNQSEWNLDHIIPLAAFDLTDPTQFLQACNFKNIQPLWKLDNLRKGAKIL